MTTVIRAAQNHLIGVVNMDETYFMVCGSLMILRISHREDRYEKPREGELVADCWRRSINSVWLACDN